MNEDRIVELLVEIRDLLRDRQTPKRPALDVQDRRALERLLPVLAEQFPDGFEVWELLDVVDAGGIPAADMKIALADLSAHRIGKLLRRVTDHGGPVAGFRAVATGRGRWRLIGDPSSLTGDALAGKVRAFDSRRTKR